MILKLMLFSIGSFMVYFGIYHWPWDNKDTETPLIIDAEFEEKTDEQEYKGIDVFI